MTKHIFFILLALLLSSCKRTANTTENNTVEVEAVSDSILQSYIFNPEIFDRDAEWLYNPPYHLSKYTTEIDPRTYITALCKYENLIKDSTIVKNPGLNIITSYGTVSFKDVGQQGDMWEDYTYSGYIPCINSHVVSMQGYETFRAILTDNSTYKTQSICNIPYLSPDCKYMAAVWFEPHASEFYGLVEIYRIENGSFRKIASLWSFDFYPGEICWSGDDLLLQGEVPGERKKWMKLPVDKLEEKIDAEKKQSVMTEDWYDIFYFSPFSPDSELIGNYYIQIDKEKESKFATSFSSQDIKFDYKISVRRDRDTLYILDRNIPELLGRIVKTGNDYYIDSELIKVYTDQIVKGQYGYKVNKGFPED